MAYSVKISGYKCFKEDPQGFEIVLPVNVIVGRNNAGKSSLLDMIEFACNLGDSAKNAGAGQGTKLHCALDLEETNIQVFPTNTNSSSLGNFRAYGKRFIGARIEWTQMATGGRPVAGSLPDNNRDAKATWEKVVERLQVPLAGRQFLRIAEARDVIPTKLETIADQLDTWFEAGDGVTRTIAAFLNRQQYNKRIVTHEFLKRLNEIVKPIEFTSIDALMDAQHRWEVCLGEPGKGSEIALSSSGAGLKTVLCVLTLMELYPRIIDPTTEEGKPGLVFALEELENSLHPALQRRLLEYVRKRAIETKSTVFLTTHSPVAIDLFQGDEEAQIVHVVHNGISATVTRVDDYGRKRSILEDIGSKASDLLQANCVVWVEGPSDRIYFNQWIKLWTKGELREGAHYLCMFYGGALLSHVSADDPEEATEVVRLLRLNRNAVGIFDHDGESEDTPIKKHVVRVVSELENNDGLAWVTKGREVENYLPSELLESRAQLSSEQAENGFIRISEVLSNDKTSDYAKKFRNSGTKVWMAYDMRERLTRGHLEKHMDLSLRLDQVVAYIKRANSL